MKKAFSMYSYRVLVIYINKFIRMLERKGFFEVFFSMDVYTDIDKGSDLSKPYIQTLNSF